MSWCRRRPISRCRSTRRQHHRRIAQILAEHFPEIRRTNLSSGPPLYGAGRLQAIALLAASQPVRHGTLSASRSDCALPAGFSIERHSNRRSGAATARTFAPDHPGGGAGCHARPCCPRRGSCLHTRELCQQVGNTTQLFPVLRGLWLVHLVRGTLPTAYALGNNSSSSRNALRRPLLLEAHRALGTSLFLRGEFASAWTHLEQGIRLYDVAQHRDLAIHYGQDSGAVYLGYAAWTLWIQGYAQQSLRYP